MAIITYEKVELQDRAYQNHSYTIERYENSRKVNIRVRDGGSSVFLKMSLAETKDLITRLQFAVYEADNG